MHSAGQLCLLGSALGEGSAEQNVMSSAAEGQCERAPQEMKLAVRAGCASPWMRERRGRRGLPAAQAELALCTGVRGFASGGDELSAPLPLCGCLRVPLAASAGCSHHPPRLLPRSITAAAPQRR